VLIAQGGQYAGWSLYLHEGRPAYCYNAFGVEVFKIYGNTPVSAGEHEVRMEFTYDGGGLGKGGDVVLRVDGEAVGAGRVERTVAMIFSLDETTDLGEDTGSAVSDDYAPKDSSFNGRVRWVQIDVDSEAGDEGLMDPEDQMRIAMSKQ
jgi:arylsulfatase